MGKRELLLVLGLIVAGAAVYHATAPPPAPGQQEFSLTRLIDLAKRHVQGNRASAETTVAAAFPLSAATTELRVTLLAESLTITGEDRDDVASELHVRSNGYDQQEAARLAAATTVKMSEAGGRMAVAIVYPKEARQRATLVLRVPARLRVSLARYTGKLAISGTGDVELVETRGEARIGELTGKLSASHRGGELTVTDIGALKLNVRGADVRLTRVRGDVTVQSQAGELRGSEFGGAIDIESNGTDVELESLGTTRAPIHVKATDGSVKLAGVRSEARVDGRNAGIEVILQEAAPLAVYSEGDEDIAIGTPRGGYHLDAATTSGGELHLPEGSPEITVDGTERRAEGAVRGGGPTLMLRATSGDIELRTADSPRVPGAA